MVQACCSYTKDKQAHLILLLPHRVFEHLVRRHGLAVTQLVCRLDPKHWHTILQLGALWQRTSFGQRVREWQIIRQEAKLS
jgi:hypothetical protein